MLHLIFLLAPTVATLPQRPCDILAASGAPCVAAHAVSRALFAAYGGPLFQVQRSGDRAVRDIGVLAPGGYVNASAVDAFCGDGACSISALYDQTGHRNHVTTNASGDRGVNATRMRTSAGGVPIYAAVFERIMGYRSSLANGTAVGNEEELIYMVTSGAAPPGGPPAFNNECCFDYGNAETRGGPFLPGQMETINFSNTSVAGWSRGVGDGPWLLADLEQGLWGGNTTPIQPSNEPLPFPFVTAILRGALDGFALAGGDATASGALKVMYAGPRPNKRYQPMQKQGGIVLGVGGDNSRGSRGIFYEGALTLGLPDAATDAALHEGIVAAGYGR